MWRLYYHDRSTFTSEDGGWTDAPAWGVLALAVLDDWVGYSRQTGDFYVYPPWMAYPIACDHWGLMDYLLQTQALDPDERLTSKTPEYLEAAGVKFGRSVSDEEWQDVKRWVSEDLPRKSARYVHERP